MNLKRDPTPLGFLTMTPKGNIDKITLWVLDPKAPKPDPRKRQAWHIEVGRN